MTGTAGVSPQSESGWVTARIGKEGFVTRLTSGSHELVADEPASVGGTDAGMTPYELLLSALGSCTAMTLRIYATRKSWPLEAAVVRLRSSRSHAKDCEDCETKTVGLPRIQRHIELEGPLTDEQRSRLLSIADRCPVKQTFEKGMLVEAVAALD